MSNTHPMYFQRHIFFCTNQRDNGESCCAHNGAQAAFEHCKVRVKEMGLSGAGKVLKTHLRQPFWQDRDRGVA
mgnify:CR=1 FL=1